MTLSLCHTHTTVHGVTVCFAFCMKRMSEQANIVCMYLLHATIFILNYSVYMCIVYTIYMCFSACHSFANVCGVCVCVLVRRDNVYISFVCFVWALIYRIEKCFGKHLPRIEIYVRLFLGDWNSTDSFRSMFVNDTTNEWWRINSRDITLLHVYASRIR